MARYIDHVMTVFDLKGDDAVRMDTFVKDILEPAQGVVIDSQLRILPKTGLVSKYVKHIMDLNALIQG